MAAYPVAELSGYRILDSHGEIGDGIEQQESFELRNAAEQTRVDSTHKRIEREKRRHLVPVEQHRFLRVTHGIVQLVLLQLVVLQQRMVRTLGEEKRRPVECVDQSETAASQGGGEKTHVVVDDVVPAKHGCISEKPPERRKVA